MSGVVMISSSGTWDCSCSGVIPSSSLRVNFESIWLRYEGWKSATPSPFREVRNPRNRCPGRPSDSFCRLSFGLLWRIKQEAFGFRENWGDIFEALGKTLFQGGDFLIGANLNSWVMPTASGSLPSIGITTPRRFLPSKAMICPSPTTSGLSRETFFPT